MSTVDVLRAARERLAQPGAWAKGSDTDTKHTLDDSYRVCAFLAVSDVPGVDINEREAALDTLIRAIGLSLDYPINELFEWNDAPERTLDEVLAAFDAAIDSAVTA